MSRIFVIETATFTDGKVEDFVTHEMPRSFTYMGDGPILRRISSSLDGIIDRIRSVEVRPEYMGSKKGDYVTISFNGQNNLFRYADYYIGPRLCCNDDVEKGLEVDSDSRGVGYITLHYNNATEGEFFRVLRFDPDSEINGQVVQMGIIDVPESRQSTT